MKLEPAVRQAIELHPSEDVALIARDVGRQFNQTIPITLVVRVRGSLQRVADVSRAKAQAATTLDAKVERIERASDVLESLFLDNTLSLKDRIEASKELRQWTKLGMDSAGIADPETETLFVVDAQWNPFAESGK